MTTAENEARATVGSDTDTDTDTDTGAEVELDPALLSVRADYDRVAPAYTDLLRDNLATNWANQAMLRLFADLVREAGPGPVADIGCGPGRITPYLAGLGLDVFGVDLSPGMIEVARREHPGLRFEVGSMTALGLGTHSLAGALAGTH